MTATSADLDSLPRQPAPGARLTQHQLNVLAWAAEGLTNVAIGRRMGVREDTVREHLRKIAVKLGARNRTHAVHRAWEEGYFARKAAV